MPPTHRRSRGASILPRDATIPRLLQPTREPPGGSARFACGTARTSDSTCGARRGRNPTAGTSTSSASEAFYVGDHAPPHLLVRKPAVRGAHVLAYVRDAAGGWNRTGHGWMRHDELEQKLRPVRSVDLSCETRQRMPGNV